jgi:predicted transglutaminase-like cysteine proteinase
MPSQLERIRMKQAGALPAPAGMIARPQQQDMVFRAPTLKIANPLLGTYVPQSVLFEAAQPVLPKLFELPALPQGTELQVRPLPSELRNDGCDSAPLPLAPAIANTVRQPARPGNPDVFGSVALAVSRTSLDDKWLPVAGAGRLKSSGPWSAFLADARHLSRAAQISAVNSWVNARNNYVEDARQYGMMDYWANAAQSLSRGRGDCEDYAIAKMQMLRALGVPAGDMYLVIARDLVRRIDHAVLAVALNGDLLVLDNETNRILRSDEIRDYRPLFSFNAHKRWTHGYRIEQPAAAPVQYAAISAPPGPRPAL